MNKLEKNEQRGEQELRGKELYELKKEQKEEAHKKVVFKETLSEAPMKIGKYLLYSVIVVGIVGGIGWYIATRPPTPESDIVSKERIHWHPELAIYINGEKQEIPALGHGDIHTHDTTGVIHVHPASSLVLKEDIKLGKFFIFWGKQFTSSCIFDFCSGQEGTLKMLVNGIENLEFENYIMQDKDKIELRYE